MAEIGLVASIVGVATVGVKLAMTLREVGCEISSASREIHDTATSISLFLMTLKQIGNCLEDSESPHSAGAIETIDEITTHGRSTFDQLNIIVSRTRKEIRRKEQSSLSLKRRVQWVLNKSNVQYLTRQLDSSKLTLSLMLQVFQLRKTMEGPRYTGLFQ